MSVLGEAAASGSSKGDVEMDGLGPIWSHHVDLLNQAQVFLTRMQDASPVGYVFGQRLGPHLRHILEHYTALFEALIEREVGRSSTVDYDSRPRNRMVETDPASARSSIEATLRTLLDLKACFPHDVDLPLMAKFATGPLGASSLTVLTSLGRELLFLESHTIHHFALLAKYARRLGVELSADFGKAPATIAYERRMSAEGH